MDIFNYGNKFGINFRMLSDDPIDADANTKLSHDSYDVFVNNDYVGKHMLVSQNEDISNVSDFLHQQGFHNVNLEVRGDHIVVASDSPEDANKMHRALEVFLQNR
ncbi:hypothetical protein QA612_07815 [Evansella sp. AB-P1]|uniref:hypothetical protein n=1 Tax=Evansella sp. AB-P1 TaxID=3037653 RepID=UPI00241D3D57|nr:hypothetical protein [Evansella sp. AB-P1]MDG5787398.1 hypothetical protein [Evansella sp. AB-P1]